MVAKVVTVAFEGVEARRVDVEVQLTGGQVCFVLVGLGDKAVGESRERVRAAFAGLGLALPARRLVVNLAPADLPKEGSHYDLPIALAVMAAMGVIPADSLNGWAIIGELGLDGQIAPVVGALPAAVAANGMGLGLICPESSGPEAAWAGDVPILAPRSLIALINHFKGVQVLSPPVPGPMLDGPGIPDLRDVKGQEGGKRALEIAAAGGHNLCFVGPPGSGKSMLAQRLPGLLPPLSPVELLETSMVHSVAGLIAKGSQLITYMHGLNGDVGGGFVLQGQTFSTASSWNSPAVWSSSPIGPITSTSRLPLPWRNSCGLLLSQPITDWIASLNSMKVMSAEIEKRRQICGWIP